jgi:hypothetical protein
MWIEFDKAQKETDSGQESVLRHADQFLWHLQETTRFLDRSRKSNLHKDVWIPWNKLIDEKKQGEKS